MLVGRAAALSVHPDSFQLRMTRRRNRIFGRRAEPFGMQIKSAIFLVQSTGKTS
jgi:hypothetical protein